MRLVSTWVLIGLVGFGITALSLAPRATSGNPDQASAGPKLEFIQAIETDNQGHPYSLGVNSMTLIGDYLYVSAHTCGTLRYYRRDRETGKLTLAGALDAGQRLHDAFPKLPRVWGFHQSHSITLAAAKGRLYAVPADGSGMAWYEPDPKTGEPIEKGLVECPAGFEPVVSPDGNDLYIKSQPGPHYPGLGRILWYHLDAAGKPVKSGEISGPAVGNCGGPHMVMSPDGAHLYSFAVQEQKDGSGVDSTVCLKRKPAGEIEIGKEMDLTKAKPTESHYGWNTLDISPDGKWAYFASTKPPDCWLHIYKRDAATGELTVQETIAGGTKGRHFVFLPDGIGGYCGGVEGLSAFKLAPATGHMAETSQLKETAGQSPMILIHDAENGFLYAGSTDGKSAHSLFVARVEKKAATK